MESSQGKKAVPRGLCCKHLITCRLWRELAIIAVAAGVENHANPRYLTLTA